MRSRRLLRSWLMPWLVVALAGCGASILPSVHSESERLPLAKRLYDRGDYRDAIELLKTFISGSGGSAQVDEAIYLLGDSYLKIKEWSSASGEFERLLRDYPESDSSGSAAFKLGDAYFGQTRPADFDQEFTRKALEQWASYLREYPGHWLNGEAARRIEKCRNRLANKLAKNGELYLKLQLPGPARVYFTQVTEEYPDTVGRPVAELGLAMCDARQGKKAEAIAQFRSIESKYPGQKVAERAARERRRIERR